MPGPIPILVLAGSDRQPGHVPDGLEPDDMLTGLKGAQRLPSGRLLVAELVERLKLSGCFQPPLVLGPERAYAGQVDCEVLDADGDLPATLDAVREVLRSRFPPGDPVALTSCDILPTADELRRLLEESWEPHAGSALWTQFVEAEPHEMGASSWKPSYRLQRDRSGPLVNIYPGHLVIIRPAALRIRLISHLLNLAYRQRNRALGQKGWPMLAGGLGRLLAADARNLLRLRPTALSIQVPFHFVRAYQRYRRGRLSVPEFAARAARLFVTRTFRRQYQRPAVVIPVTRILSFGKDVDTKAELAEAAGSCAAAAG